MFLALVAACPLSACRLLDAPEHVDASHSCCPKSKAPVDPEPLAGCPLLAPATKAVFAPEHVDPLVSVPVSNPIPVPVAGSASVGCPGPDLVAFSDRCILHRVLLI